MAEYWVRRAKDTDIMRIYEFSKPYLEESMYGKHLDLCEKTAIESFQYGVMYDELYETYIAENENGLLGVVIVFITSSYFKGSEGDVQFFYVCPSARATGVSRALVEQCIEVKDRRRLNILYAGCHSGFNDDGKNDKMYCNLFKKYGFEVTGTNLHLI